MHTEDFDMTWEEKGNLMPPRMPQGIIVFLIVPTSEKLPILYPITPLKGAPRLRAHAPLNWITLHAPLAHRKVEASSPRIRVTN